LATAPVVEVRDERARRRARVASDPVLVRLDDSQPVDWWVTGK
jgi:hypothetical protein